jgi:spore maturation protein CgeB
MNDPHPRILLCGNIAPPTFENCWLNWLRDHDYPVRAFDPNALLAKNIPSTLLWRILWRFFSNALAIFASRHLMEKVCSFQPDLLLVVSGNLVTPTALQSIREKTRATLFHYYGEDFFNPLNIKNTLRRSIHCYDHLFTTKTFNVPELTALGLANVSFIPCGYIPGCHFPVTVTAEDRQCYGSDLSFVGTFEKQRARTLAQLGQFDLKIWGSDWHKAGKKLGLQKAIQSRAIYCEGMSRVLNASLVNLAFLRKANRDRHDQRTFEIPACGGFSLSERTDEVLSFFEEGKEIECFESVEELKDKAAYYIAHDAQRQMIAAAGLARVCRSAYSYTDHIQTILKQYSEMR